MSARNIESGTNAEPSIGLKLNKNKWRDSARLTDDGRIRLSIADRSNSLSKNSEITFLKQLQDSRKDAFPPSEQPLPGTEQVEHPPLLNVVIQIVGSRGDVQPFVALGQVLRDRYGHRVRIATHAVFREFVEGYGIEHYSIGGDPAELMAFMVKHPGLLPGFDAIKEGQIGERRKTTYTMLEGCWKSCIDAARESSVCDKPFVADVIIANPPSFAHVHCAQKLGINLHIMFTMPWTPTQAFPHPLTTFESSDLGPSLQNLLSYPLVELIVWQGLGDVINRFRRKMLQLEPISFLAGPSVLAKARAPHTYCWSPSLIPKPEDWSSHISVAGFFFLQAPSYTPGAELARFLNAGPPPVYIGFGSIVVENPNQLTKTIFEAVRLSGQRALVSQGWGDLGGAGLRTPESIHLLGAVPHDWLFTKVSCVVHHGGAGTTAAGIAAGKPTVVVPFFGDQPFWGNMIYKAGAGPPPIPQKLMTAKRLAAAIAVALRPSSVERAAQLSLNVNKEDGKRSGAKIFHEQLPITELRCPLASDRTVVWKVKKTGNKMSALAAAVLMKHQLLLHTDIVLCRHLELHIDDGAVDPLSAAIMVLTGAVWTIGKSLAEWPTGGYNAVKALRKENSQPTTVLVPRSSDGSAAVPAEVLRPEGNSQPFIELPAGTGSTYDEVETDSAEGEEYFGAPVTWDAVSGFYGSEYTADTLSDYADSDKMTTVRPNGAVGFGPDVNATGKTTDASSQQQESASAASFITAEDGRALATGYGASKLKIDPSTAEAPMPSNIEVAGTALLGSGIGLAKMCGRLTLFSATMPLEAMNVFAKGFRNAPALYGDDTIRPQKRITGFRSGLTEAGREFTFGLYDGITGIFTQPVEEIRKRGPIGVGTGIMKGTLGTVFKPAAGAMGLVGLTYEGITKSVQNLGQNNLKNFLRASRFAQGWDEYGDITPDREEQIVTRFTEHGWKNESTGHQSRRERRERK